MRAGCEGSMQENLAKVQVKGFIFCLYNMYLSPAWVTSTMKGVLQTIVWMPANFEFTHLQAVWQQFTGYSVWWLMITSHFVDSGGGVGGWERDVNCPKLWHDFKMLCDGCLMSGGYMQIGDYCQAVVKLELAG